MTHHYILTLNPYSSYEWDKCNLRNPLTGESPDLTTMVREAVAQETGSYLVAVKVEVEILEQGSVNPSLESKLKRLAA